MDRPNWLQRTLAKSLLGVSLKDARSPFSTSITTRYGGGIFDTRKSYVEQYTNWVFACVQARSEEVGNIDLKLYKGDEEVESHELIDLIFKVNPYMTKFELFEATQAYKDLDGNAFWFLSRDNDGKGRIREIYILRPDKVQIVPDSTNGLIVKGYVYTGPDGAKVPFDAKEILHHKTFNPMTYFPYPGRGMGIVQAAYSAIATDNAAREWNYNFFKNGARPDGVLQVPGDSAMDEGEYKRLQAEWESTHQGTSNSHKTAILSGGLEWKELTRPQADMEFNGQRLFSRDEILALFRTPKSIIGITDDVNRANAEASAYVFALRTVKPLMQRLVDTLNEMLVPEFGEGLEFRFTSPVPADVVAQTAERSAAIGKWKTRNEIRAEEGLPPSEEGDKFFDTLMMVPVDEVKPEKKAVRSTTTKAVKPKKKTAAEKAAEKAVASFVAKMPGASKTYTVRDLSAEVVEKYIEAWKVMVNSTAPLKKTMDDFFKEQEQEVLRNIETELKGLFKKDLKKKAVDDLLYDEDEALEAGITLITPFLREYIRTSGEQAMLFVGGTKFDADTEKLNAFVKRRASYFSDSVNETTKDKLVRSIREGLDQGESKDLIKARVESIYEEASKVRSELIARTEIAAASNEGATGAYIQAGITKQEWAVVNPEDVDCQVNAGEVVEIGKSFNSGDVAPPVHPNCQCTLLPVFED